MLATNQLQFVQSADLILLTKAGRVAESGTYSSLMAAGGAFAALMREAQVHTCGTWLCVWMCFSVCVCVCGCGCVAV